jgi:hypothetical protein
LLVDFLTMATMVCFSAYHIAPALGPDLPLERVLLLLLDLFRPVPVFGVLSFVPMPAVKLLWALAVVSTG